MKQHPITFKLIIALFSLVGAFLVLFLNTETSQETNRIIGSSKQNSLSVYAKGSVSKIPGWLIKQSHVLYGKNIKIVLTKTAFKWENAKSQISYVMKAPKWEVVGFSKRARRIFRCSAKDFEFPATRIDMMFTGANWSHIPIRKLNTRTVGGIKIDQYVSTKPQANVYNLHYWVCPDIKAPRPVLKVMQKIYNAPDLNGFPTKQMYQRTKVSKPKVGFHSYVMQRMPNIPKAEFSIPANYKTAKSIQGLYSNKRHEQGLDLLMGDSKSPFITPKQNKLR